MPLDPIIAAGFKGLQLQDPLEQYARVNQLQQAQQQNALNALKMQEYQRGVEQQNRLREFIPTLTPQNRSQLLSFGDPGRQAYESLLKGEKEAREAEKAQVDIAVARMKQSRDLLPSVMGSPDPQTAYANWRSYTLQNLPGLANLIPEQYSPQTVQGLMLEADKALEQHFVSQNLGGAQQVVAAPKYGQGPGRVVPGTYAAEVPLPPAIEAQKARLATAGRALPQPKEPSKAIEVLDPVTNKPVIVSAEEAIRGRMTPAKATEGLPPKEIQKREASFPKTTAALRSFETQADTLVKNLTKLRDHPGLSGITGLIFGITPAITPEARSAKADLDNILARGGFAELAAMRQASPTGGALGNISNQEVKYLRDAFGALNTQQDTETFKQKINDVIDQLNLSKRNIREEYDNTYEYRTTRDGGAAAAPPGLSSEDKQALDWANKNPKDPRAAQIKQRLGM